MAVIQRCLLVVLFVGVLSAQVKVWQGTLHIPISEEGLPDENPPFDQFSAGRFNYPYTLRQNIHDRRVEKDLRAVYLENEFLKCSVLPDLGGHVYTCVDKTTGKPMFYANPSIKEQLVSFRGAWAAFGIEFNFPVSHNWVSVSPVDFSFRQLAGGGATVTVGNVDRVYGMEWTVDVTLRPGASILETHTTLLNRDRVRHRFYWWTNAGVEVWDDSKISYPMQFTASHGFKDVDTWPVNAGGRDLSIIANHLDGPVSRFVHGSREPFMGIYHPHTQTGVVHYSDYAQLPAKKIWTWGVDSEGLGWRKKLSDNNSAYAEVQAGLFRNQETFAFLEPQQVIQFSEYWMPVSKIGGITRANLNGVLFLNRRAKDVVEFGIQANREVKDGTVLLLDGTLVVYQEKVTISPGRPFVSHAEKLVENRKYTLRWRDSKGATLLEHTEEQFDWTPTSEIRKGTQAEYVRPVRAQWTDGDYLEVGRDAEQLGKVLQASDVYGEGLARFPESSGLLKAAGRLNVMLLRYAEAASELGKAEGRDTTDAEVRYYMGLALAALDRTRGAQTEWEAAARNPAWRAASFMELAELMAREKRLEEARLDIQQALMADPAEESIQEEAVVLGAMPASEALRQFPNSNLLRLANGQSIWGHLAADPERVLNVASTYMRLGDFKSAYVLLNRRYPAVVSESTEPGSVLPQNHALVTYYLAYCLQMMGQPDVAAYKAAAVLPVRYIFPNRPEAEAVLRAALSRNDQDAHAHWLLGALLFAHGQTEGAVEQWQLARRLDPTIPSLDASLGHELMNEGKTADAAAVLTEGTTSDSTNALVYLELDEALLRLGRGANERAAMLGRFPKDVPRPSALTFLYARELAASGDFGKAVSLFENQYFEDAEGGADARVVYIEVKLREALARARSQDCSGLAEATRVVANIAFTANNLSQVLERSKSLQNLRGEIQHYCPVAH